MLKTLYWNVYQKLDTLAPEIEKLAKAKNVDILVLAEICKNTDKKNTDTLVQDIEKRTGLTYLRGTDPESAWLHTFYKKNQAFKIELLDTYSVPFRPSDIANVTTDESEYFTGYLNRFERMLFFKITVNKKSFLLVPLHFPSRMYCSINKQLDLAELFKKQIEVTEHKEKLRSIVFGDFNMNPFELGMINHKGFFALPSQELIGMNSFYEIPYFSYYNPSWSKFGDHTTENTTVSRRPSGSYFFSSSSDINYYWYILDQVIIRKELITNFSLSSFEYIVGHQGGKEFIKADFTPDKSNFSDHLPIFFELNNF